MFTVTIDPILFSFGHFMVRWYSLILVGAIFVSIAVTRREAVRKSIGEEVLNDVILWIIPGGLIGARLFHVIDHWPDRFAADPIRAFYIWEGGIAIWGAVVGGLLALMVLAWRRNWRLPVLLDTLAPGLVLGMGLGRIACVITGDAMGQATNGPFGVAYVSPRALVPQLGVYYTPTPIYELILNVSIFVVLWRLRRNPLPDGALFLLFLLLYAGGRFLITFWSSYQEIAFGLNQAQLVSLIALVVGAPILIYLLRHDRETNATAT